MLTDFGIAKAASGQKLTGTGMSIGTPHYMSPEQARAQAIDGRSDIYSLGVVAYQCLAGTVPYDGEDSFSIGYKHITEPIPTPSLITADERRIFEVIKRMLMKDPADRFQSCEELVASIQGQPTAAPGAMRVSAAAARRVVGKRVGHRAEPDRWDFAADREPAHDAARFTDRRSSRRAARDAGRVPARRRSLAGDAGQRLVVGMGLDGRSRYWVAAAGPSTTTSSHGFAPGGSPRRTRRERHPDRPRRAGKDSLRRRASAPSSGSAEAPAATAPRRLPTGPRAGRPATATGPPSRQRQGTDRPGDSGGVRVDRAATRLHRDDR